MAWEKAGIQHKIAGDVDWNVTETDLAQTTERYMLTCWLRATIKYEMHYDFPWRSKCASKHEVRETMTYVATHSHPKPICTGSDIHQARAVNGPNRPRKTTSKARPHALQVRDITCIPEVVSNVNQGKKVIC